MKAGRLQFWVLWYYILSDFDLSFFGPYHRIFFAKANEDKVSGGKVSGFSSTGISGTQKRQRLVTALQFVETIQRQMSNNSNCSSNQSVILDIAFQHARWKSEALLAVEVANLLTSLWRVKTADGYSMAENDTFLYNLVRANVLFSSSVFGSVICFEKDQYRNYERFCPYAFKDKAYHGVIHVKDISVGHDYLTSPETIWWREPRELHVNRAAKPLSTEIYTVRLNQSTADSTRNVTVPIVEYDADGFWTRPYFDCFGGEIWMITFLAPFFNDSNQFLGVVSIDVELSSIDINQCDAQVSTPSDGGVGNGKSDRTGSTDSVKLLEFLGTHKCKPSTQCEPIPNQGFKRGSYRCTCKRGYYYPDANVNVKAFNGSVIEEEYDKKQEGLPTKYDDEFDCVPCSEGCEECTDGSPCVYNLKIIPRVVLISIDTLATLMAAVAGAVVFIFRESKVFDVASPAFLEVLLLGSVLMYSSLAAAYVEPSVLSCAIEVWFYQCGFFLVYGTLALKVWRVSASFRVRSPRRVEVTEGMMAGRLVILCSCLVIYLLVWTLLMPPQVIDSTSELRFKQCSIGDMGYVNVCGNFILLVGALFLCVRVRNAPSAYNETRFSTWAVYNAMFITCFVAVLRILTANNTNPDILFATKFILIQMTATVTLLLLFVPKFVLLKKMRGQDASRRLTDLQPRGSIQTPNGSYLNDTSTLERENEDLKEEVKRLAIKVANLHSRLMKDKNKHIKSGSNSLSRVRASTNEDYCDDTLKKMSSSPVSRFLSSGV